MEIEDGVFIIAETRFDCGLNFLTTCNLWQEIKNKNPNSKAKLFFISFEAKPSHPHEITQKLNHLPQLASQITEFLPQYYLPLPATHRLKFKHNVYLDLIVGDINSTLNKYAFKADCWFLNEFTPNKNFSLGDSELINHLSQHSKINSTFATQMTNEELLRGLKKYGFIVNKTNNIAQGNIVYGHYAKGQSQKNQTSTKQFHPTPWFNIYSNVNTPKKVIIIGGGISGAATAYSLANRGYKVILYEKYHSMANGASGNYQAILYGSYTGDYTPILELSLSAYRYSHFLIKSLLKESSQEFSQCGLIQLASNLQQLKQQRQLLNANFPADFCHFIDQSTINQLINLPSIGQNNNATPFNNGGVLFPYGTWFRPQALIKALTNHPNITLKTMHDITKLMLLENNLWQIYGANLSSANLDSAPINKMNKGLAATSLIDTAYNVVLCNADNLTQFAQTANIPLRKIRGQISIANAHEDMHIKVILCNNGYVTPAYQKKYVIGATFNLNDQHTRVTDDEHQKNLHHLHEILPDIAANLNINQLDGRASIRASTYDYLPLVGPIANETLFKTAYKNLSLDSNYWIDTPCPYLPGLFINAAHGAKGMLTAPIAGEIIASYIDNNPIPCSENLRTALHPNRLWRNEIIKNKHL